MKLKANTDKDYFIGGDYYRFTDSTMSRILEHSQNGMFIISAMKGGFPIGKSFEEFTPAEKEKYLSDKEKTKQLQKDIQAKGLGFIPSLGGFKENEGTPDEINVNEFSFIVPRKNNLITNKEFVEFAVSLAKKYNQDSVLIAGIPEIANGQIRYLSPGDFNNIDWGDEVNADFTNTKVYRELEPDKRPYYTAPKKLGGRNFVFDSVSMRHMENIVGVHHVFSSWGWQKANKNKEIVIEKD